MPDNPTIWQTGAGNAVALLSAPVEIPRPVPYAERYEESSQKTDESISPLWTLYEL